MSFAVKLRTTRLAGRRMLGSPSPIHSTSWHRQFSDNGDKKKPDAFTLDDFFSNLDSSKSQTKTRRRNTPSGKKQRRGRNKAAATTSDASEDLSTFFDEVNSIMKKNKKQSDTIEKSESTDNLLASQKEKKRAISLFDMIPPKKERSPDAYDEDAYDEYMDMIDTISSSKRFLRKHTRSPIDDERAASIFAWLKAEEPVVPHSLPSLQKAMTASLSEDELLQVRKDFRSELRAQKQTLCDHYGWDNQQYTVAISALMSLGAMCAKKATGAPIDIAWQKLKEAGYEMEKDRIHNYLYVSATFSTRSIDLSSSSGGESIIDYLNRDASSAIEPKKEEIQSTIDDDDDETEAQIDTTGEIANVQDLLFNPTEQSTSIRVRTLVSKNRIKEAEQVLESNANNFDLRLRTYAPVYKAYLDAGDVPSAFNLFCKMKEGEFVILQPETYVQLIACIAEAGYFREGSESIAGVEDLGYSVGSGPQLFDVLAQELADNSVEITAASAKRLYNAFQRGFKDSNLKPLHLLESISTCNDSAEPDELVVSRVSLDETSGRCPRTGTHLRLIGLDAEQKKQLGNGLAELATEAYAERVMKQSAKAELELKRFADWLDTRTGKPYTAIVDGPNIAYYMQNFQDGRFSYHQIEFVVDALEKMGENVLVVLPQKYTQDSFLITNAAGQRRQKLTRKEKEISRELISSGKAYTVPTGCLDDHYWMYASVASQTVSTNGVDMYVKLGNEAGRWPGERPMLVSNDQMRDHKLSLLEPRLFRRWYSNFLVNFTFSAFVGEDCSEKEIGFRTADFYSREIQGNHPSSETESGLTWHFPVSDWKENESFCIRIPSDRP
mmetsp:Transcript_43018/g.104137  ORF Transcript_43018/g.104137 Transcript_43018/m.104137 type:complete len:836 (+) Transcript_43018:76-2583(+)